MYVVGLISKEMDVEKKINAVDTQLGSAGALIYNKIIAAGHI